MVEIKKGSFTDRIDAEIDKLKRGNKSVKPKSRKNKNHPKSIADIARKLATNRKRDLEKELSDDQKKELLANTMLSSMVKYLDTIKEKGAFIANLYGGTGTGASMAYGPPPEESYADYAKIWGHLGKDNVAKMYGGSFDTTSSGSTSREMVSYQKLERFVKEVKYFRPGGDLTLNLDAFFGNVPSFGFDSKEWDKARIYHIADGGVMFKLLMKIGI
ncbi:hypothetical protein ACFLZX_01135 [Nanoarchaeota archaeon]